MSLIETTTHATPRRCWLRGTVVQRRVFSQQTFPVPRETCNWHVTTYVCKPSTIGHQLGQLSLSSLPGRKMSSKLQLDVSYLS